MLKEKIGYSYNDVTIVPSEISDISSRSECNPFLTENNKLPIFASPMASVVNENNLEIFSLNGIIPILPRNVNLEKREYQMNNKKWVALSLKEFEQYFIDNAEKRIGNSNMHYFICVDIANGHMKLLYLLCYKAKTLATKYGYELTIMTGNIANPQTYRWICNLNYTLKARIIDYIRVGIGGGSGCITTSNLGCHYPQASLIDECYQEKCSLLTMHDNLGEMKYKNEILPKIVADGGIRNYDHVIKAIALGADYVMIGSLFAQCIESAGDKTIKETSEKVPIRFPIERYRQFRIDSNENWWGYYTDEFINEISKSWNESPEMLNYKITELSTERFIGHMNVKFFGMASADGQKSISGMKTKTAEGITKYLPVKYTIYGWVNNMISYLRSAMSYTNCKNIEDFIGKPELIINSISEIHAINK